MLMSEYSCGRTSPFGEATALVLPSRSEKVHLSVLMDSIIRGDHKVHICGWFR